MGGLGHPIYSQGSHSRKDQAIAEGTEHHGAYLWGVLHPKGSNRRNESFPSHVETDLQADVARGGGEAESGDYLVYSISGSDSALEWNFKLYISDILIFHLYSN